MSWPKELPEEKQVFVCLERSTWPIVVFESAEHAMAWCRDSPGGGIGSGLRIYKGTLRVIEELVVVSPTPYLAPKGEGGE